MVEPMDSRCEVKQRIVHRSRDALKLRVVL